MSRAAFLRSALFQFTPLREGRLTLGEGMDSGDKFQFTPLREGRQQIKRITILQHYFNSRPSARGDNRRESGRRS